MWLQVVENGGKKGMFFFGTYSHSLDDKSRVIMPSKLRDKLGSTVYISLGFDSCLDVYTEEAFEKKAENLSNESSMDPTIRAYKRTFFANSYQCDIDKQGRIQLTKESLEKVGITKDVIIIGIQDHVEIWDKEKYYKNEEANEASYEVNAAKIFEGSKQ